MALRRKGGSAIRGMEWEREICLCSLWSTQRHCCILFKSFSNWVAWGERSGFSPAANIYYNVKNVKHGRVLALNKTIPEPNWSSLQGSLTSPDITLIQGHTFPARYSFQVTLLLYQKAETQEHQSVPNKLLFTKTSKIFDNSCGLFCSVLSSKESL